MVEVISLCPWTTLPCFGTFGYVPCHLEGCSMTSCSFGMFLDAGSTRLSFYGVLRCLHQLGSGANCHFSMCHMHACAQSGMGCLHGRLVWPTNISGLLQLLICSMTVLACSGQVSSGIWLTYEWVVIPTILLVIVYLCSFITGLRLSMGPPRRRWHE